MARYLYEVYDVLRLEEQEEEEQQQEEEQEDIGENIHGCGTRHDNRWSIIIFSPSFVAITAPRFYSITYN